MKKLKIKVFSILCLMLTVFLLIILMIFNYQEYKNKQTNIEEALKKVVNMNYKDEVINMITNNEEAIFMDSVIYTVKLKQDNSISYIISHTYDKENQEKILEYINEILEKEKNLKFGLRKTYIGNLYFADYCYSFEQGNKIVIFENSITKFELISSLKKTLLITIITEIFVMIVSFKLTMWIVKPAEESFNKQKQFIEDASHELKTPLAVITANADNIEMDSENGKWINNIKSEADRMNKLIMQLLDLAKLENKKQEEYGEENISKIIEKSALTFESIAFEKNIEIETNIQENIEFKCSGDDIKQLITILIDNAITHSNTENGKINVTLVKDKNEIVLQVINNGEPIPKADEEKIFERFYKRDDSRNRNSNNYGLGLAIAKNIVMHYNGKITAHSENKTTTFKVIF